MQENLVFFSWSYGWVIFGVAWGISTVTTLWHWYHYLRPQGTELFVSCPYGTDARSPVVWIIYGCAWLSQISPVGALTRIVPGSFSRLVLDLYIPGWGVLGIVALKSPEKMAFFAPLFLWRFMEFTATMIYQRIFRAGFPKRMEADPEKYHLGYRALVIDIVNYLIFAVFFAAVYQANATRFTPPLESASDAFYFSIVTMATLGYGDIAPIGRMRGVAVIQVLFGIFMIAVIVGVLLGQRVLYVRRGNRSNQER